MSNCIVCGERLNGDGYTSVIHCPNNSDEESFASAEPDAGPFECFNGDTKFAEALGDALDTETVDEVGELQIFKQWATRNPNWACRLLGIKVKTSRGWGVFLRNEFGKFALSFPGDIVVVTNSGRHGVFKKLESVKKETYAGGKYPTSPSNMIRVSAPATALKSLQEILK